MKILIIDDSETSRACIRQVLHDFGLKDIHEENDGGQGLMYLGANMVDLVILDWEMPNISGIQVLRAIRKNNKTEEIPIIMCTSNADEKHLVDALQAGVTGYIVKPFNAETFKHKFQQIGVL